MSGKRVLIVGGPRTGKSTDADRIASVLGVERVWRTDSLIHLGWSEASLAVVSWLSRPGPWVIEGVAVPRAVRKWLAANPTALSLPCDELVEHWTAHEVLTPGQETMAKGCVTVWKEVRAELQIRNARAAKARHEAAKRRR